jgi:hypothetical protein
MIDYAMDYVPKLATKVLMVFFVSNCGEISLPAGFFPTTSVSAPHLEAIFNSIAQPLGQFCPFFPLSMILFLFFHIYSLCGSFGCRFNLFLLSQTFPN